MWRYQRFTEIYKCLALTVIAVMVTMMWNHSRKTTNVHVMGGYVDVDNTVRVDVDNTVKTEVENTVKVDVDNIVQVEVENTVDVVIQKR